MSYITVALMARDKDLINRCKAAAAMEIVANGSEYLKSWMGYNGMTTPMWYLSAQPGWAAAWEYAEANAVDNIGADSSVITDAMILSAVQTVAAAETPAPEPNPEGRSESSSEPVQKMLEAKENLNG